MAGETLIRDDATGEIRTSGGTQVFGVPDPTGEPDGRWLMTSGGAAIWDDGPAGGGVDVTDGSTTVTAATEIEFTSGATVTDGGGGLAQVAIDGGGGGGSGGGGLGSSELVYRYTVTGADKASIDTGADTPDAGSNDWTDGDILEVWLYGRTDEAVQVSDALLTFNNDSGSTQYVWERLRVNAGATAVAESNGAANVDLWIPGASYLANTFGVVKLTVPNFGGTVGLKGFESVSSMGTTSANNGNLLTMSGTYRSTSAITRLALTAPSGKKFKVGTQLLIYKRKAVASSPAAVELVATATPSGAASVDFSGLDPTAYTYWMIEYLLATSSGSDQLLKMQVNGDSGSHYGYWLNDATAGAVAANPATAAVLGYLVASSQSLTQGQAVFATGHAGATHGGRLNYGGGAGAGGTRAGYGTFIVDFNVAAAVSAIHLFAASGNLTGDVRLYGMA